VRSGNAASDFAMLNPGYLLKGFGEGFDKLP
jgi:hypothetical protein